MCCRKFCFRREQVVFDRGDLRMTSMGPPWEESVRSVCLLCPATLGFLALVPTYICYTCLDFKFVGRAGQAGASQTTANNVKRTKGPILPNHELGQVLGESDHSCLPDCVSPAAAHRILRAEGRGQSLEKGAEKYIRFNFVCIL